MKINRGVPIVARQNYNVLFYETNLPRLDKSQLPTPVRGSPGLHPTTFPAATHQVPY